MAERKREHGLRRGFGTWRVAWLALTLVACCSESGEKPAAPFIRIKSPAAGATLTGPITVEPGGGMITHNLSTALIGPDGKIVKWYHGGDWQVSDLIKDAASARAPKA